VNWELLGRRIWHGITAAILAGGTALAVLQQWPTKFQWLLLGSGMSMAFVKGVNGFNANPEVTIAQQDLASGAGVKP
jgi:enterochelin esterase-like enzyme